jgi:hypothetical protein
LNQCRQIDGLFSQRCSNTERITVESTTAIQGSLPTHTI